MQHFKTSTAALLKTRTLGFGLVLFLATLLTPFGRTFAHGNENHRPVKVTATSGHVEVVHQIPGGTIRVGVDYGRAGTGHRDVTIVHQEPRREVTVIKTVQHGRCGKKVTVIEKYETHGKHRHHRDSYVSR